MPWPRCRGCRSPHAARALPSRENRSTSAPRAIVEALKLRLGSDTDRLVVPTKNLEAYNLYLKARFFFHRFTEPGLRKSLDFYQHVLLQEPGYARAYAGI